MAERQSRIDLALAAFEEGERQHKDAVDELELHQLTLEGLDPENPDERDEYEQTKDSIRAVQMRIGMLERTYEEVKGEYEKLYKEKARIEEEIKAFEGDAQLRADQEAAESAMDEQREAMETLELELESLGDRLKNTKKAALKEEIKAEIESLRTEYDNAKAAFKTAQTAFNGAAKQKMAKELERQEAEAAREK